MQLKCKINNVVYENTLVQGIPFSEEYSEVLDSASIIIDQVKQMNIKPYDDVYIYDGEFYGFDENGNVIGNNKFYKHFLVNQFSEEMLFLNTNELIDKANNGNLYKYKIELFSETKGLETIQLPNISITQPLNATKKVSTYKYLQQYIDMYSPKIKVAINETEWEYKNKYKLDTSLKEIFDDSYTPDFTLNSPNLRDILSKLMITKDMIPYVENNVIKALDITKRTKEFDMTKGEIGYIYGSLSSSNYAENLKTNYINALSQEKSCRMIEYLGFRNSDVSLMKIEDLRIETRFPIYKINKIYMCYYKKITIGKYNEETGTVEKQQKAFLCKQDITPLVKLNSERNLLSKNFDEMENDNPPENIEELSKYYMATVGYDIGSNYITGWGNKYEYLKDKNLSWYSSTKSYIENIIDNVDQFTPLGIYDYSYFIKKGELITFTNTLFPESDNIYTHVITSDSSLLTPFSNYGLALKGFFFQVEYDGFYNGTVITTKDGAESDITINDNQSNSLPLLEYDGLSQKEKINRFGNKGYTITVRYTDINDLQPLGSYFSKDDVIIYHREYTINDNVINCTYYGMKDYVLKNYFTSVYAKHRPYNLMSYGESVSRAENKKLFLILSKDKMFYEKEQNILNLKKNFNRKIFSCFKWFETTNVPSIKHFKFPDKINYGYFVINNEKYAADLNVFVHGNSLCFNSRMYDNVSSGVYIKKIEPFKGVIEYTYNWLIDPQNSYTGSLQSWHMTVDDIETGFLKNIGFYVCHADQSIIFNDMVDVFPVLDKLEDESKETLDRYYNQLFNLPMINFKNQETNIIGNTFEINKDNKEIVDITYQLEPIAVDSNILFSPWMMKLSDLLSNYNKFNRDFLVKSTEPSKIIDCYFAFETVGDSYNASFNGEVILENLARMSFFVKEDDFDKLIDIQEEFSLVMMEYDYGKKDQYFIPYEKNQIIGLKIIVNSIQKVNENEISFNITQTSQRDITGGKDPDWDNSIQLIDNYDFTLNRIVATEFNPVPEGYLFFTNVKIKNNKNNFGRIETALESFSEFKYIHGINFVLESLYEERDVFFYNNNEKVLGYPQTMFILESPDFLKKELVYNEYPYHPENSEQIKFKEAISNSRPFETYFSSDYISNNSITIKLDEEIKEKNTKSLQYWYLDGLEVKGDIYKGYTIDDTKASYKFVFGVNLTEEDLIKDEIKIYISTLSSMNKKVYDKNYNLIGENANYYTTEEVTGSIETISIETEDRDDYIDIIITPNEILDYFKNNLYYSPEKDLICTFYIAPLSGSYEYGKNTRYKIEYEQENGIKFVSSNQELPNLEFKFIDNKLIATIDKYKIGGHFINRIIFNNGTTCRINFSSHPIYGEKQYYTKY